MNDSFLKSIISIPFRVIHKLSNWALGQSTLPSELQARYPNVSFQGIAKISVGERVFIGQDCLFVAKANIIIGNDTMIAPRVTIITGTHDPVKNPMWKTTIFRPILIGEYVWIGIGVIILPGVKIGDNAIIGAGAVVSRHVPAGAVVIGNPARIIHYREIPQVDTVTQSRYPYWDEIYGDFLPSDQVTKIRDSS